MLRGHFFFSKFHKIPIKPLLILQCRVHFKSNIKQLLCLDCHTTHEIWRLWNHLVSLDIALWLLLSISLSETEDIIFVHCSLCMQNQWRNLWCLSFKSRIKALPQRLRVIFNFWDLQFRQSSQRLSSRIILSSFWFPHSYLQVWLLIF